MSVSVWNPGDVYEGDEGRRVSELNETRKEEVLRSCDEGDELTFPA